MFITTNCCDARWTGLDTAHCANCHENFSDVAGFDRHRRYGKCLDPATLVDRGGARVFREAGRVFPCWVLVSGVKGER
jgi:hypothetical protein